MRGHGTYSADDILYASLAGVVERVNKLISVTPLKTRFVVVAMYIVCIITWSFSLFVKGDVPCVRVSFLHCSFEYHLKSKDLQICLFVPIFCCAK